jgi:serine/threonine-protein kinase
MAVNPPMTASAEGADKDASDDVIGRTIAGKYQVLRVIGRGGMGSVYEAEHLGLGKHVAIKFITREWATDDIVSNRFAREARAASIVESPHIVTVFDVGTENQRPYFVMELLRGEDLGARLKRLHRLPIDEALHVIAQTLRGLARAHEAGIVHRDLKPDNLFLSETEQDPLFVKIVDFGISKIKKADKATIPLALTHKGTVLGTPFYMSPEQAQAKEDVDERADLYSVGAILFECLSGRPPHTGNTYEQVILSICMTDAPDLRTLAPSTSPAVCAFVKRALERDRIQRFKSARQMLAALHEISPQERARVPLEGAEILTTQRSGGVPEMETADASDKVHIASMGTPAHGQTPAHGRGSISSAPPAPPVHGSSRPLVVALSATALGVGLALVGVSAFTPRATIIVTTPPSSTPDHAPAPSASVVVAPPPSATEAPPPSASASSHLAPHAPASGKKPDDLQLLRELPK